MRYLVRKFALEKFDQGYTLCAVDPHREFNPVEVSNKGGLTFTYAPSEGGNLWQFKEDSQRAKFIVLYGGEVLAGIKTADDLEKYIKETL